MKREDSQIEEMRAEIAMLREQVEQQTVANLQGTELAAPKQVVRDRGKPVGLNPALASFYAAKTAQWKHHPHNEIWARRNGYRKAVSTDFLETDGMQPDELFELAEETGERVLYVCPREHQEARRRDAERRSAIAANQKLPEFHGPDGRATVEEMTNGTSRQP